MHFTGALSIISKSSWMFSPIYLPFINHVWELCIIFEITCLNLFAIV